MYWNQHLREFHIYCITGDAILLGIINRIMERLIKEGKEAALIKAETIRKTEKHQKKDWKSSFCKFSWFLLIFIFDCRECLLRDIIKIENNHFLFNMAALFHQLFVLRLFLNESYTCSFLIASKVKIQERKREKVKDNREFWFWGILFIVLSKLHRRLIPFTFYEDSKNPNSLYIYFSS